MKTSIRCISALLLTSIPLNAGPGSSNTYSVRDLERGAELPTPLRGTIKNNRANGAVTLGMRNLKETEKSAALMAHLYRNGAQNNRPFYQVMLGDTLIDLDRDPAAYGILKAFQELPDNSPSSHGVAWMPTDIAGMKNYALLLRAKILTRNGQEKEAMAMLAKANPKSGYEYMWAGEACFMLGKDDDAIEALTVACQRPGGHPENNWARKFIPMHATSLAARMGRDDMARKWGAPIRRRGINAEKWPQWKTTWSIVDKALAYGGQDRIDFRKLSSGSYDGACRGFAGDISVKLRISGGTVTDVSIRRHSESRPYSALEIIPKRIVKHQSIRVDAISGATVSSDAIVGATIEALMKASGKGTERQRSAGN